MNRKGRFAIVIMALLFGVTVDAQDFDKKNLLYRVSSVENKTVELLGFEKKPKEELVVPDEVSYKGNKYTVSSIAENAFKDCAVLKKVVAITVQVVKESAFQGCINLSTITFTNQLVEIKRNAFKDCSSLSEVSLGDNIQGIGDEAFSNCASLKSLSLGSALKSLGVGVINGSQIDTIVFPNSLTKVGRQAFADCNLLTSITFGNALTEIEAGAFEKTGIKTLSLPNSIVKIGEKAFNGCDKLETVIFGSSLKEIDANAFQGIAISSLSFPKSLQIIQGGAFKECKNLQNVSFNDNLEMIQEKAFDGCSLLSVDLTDCLADVANDAFQNCMSVVTANYSLKGIAKYLDKVKNNSIKLSDYSFEEKSEIKRYLKDYNMVLNFDRGFALFYYMDKGLLKCDVLTIFGKVISHNGGYVVSENLIMVPSDKGNGLVLKDVKGKTLTQNVYDDIFQEFYQKFHVPNPFIKFYDGYLQVRRNNRFGFIDKFGNEVVHCKYSRVENFRNGLAIVYGDKNIETGEIASGMVDSKGQEVLQCNETRYEGSYNFNKKYNLIDRNGRYEMVDKEGRLRFLFSDGKVYTFSDGLALDKKNGKYGFIDKSGKTVIPFVYDEASNFSEGLAAVGNGGRLGFIDKSNHIVIPFDYYYYENAIMAEFEGEFNGGIACVYNRDYLKGCIDKTGKIVQPYSDDDICHLMDGVYMKKTDDQIILFNKSGVLGKFDNSRGIEYNDIYGNFDGYIFVGRNGKKGVIDKNGKEILPCVYKMIDHFEDKYRVSENRLIAAENRLIEAKDENGTYLYDKTGKLIVSSDYDIEHFLDGIIQVSKDNRYGFIDMFGRIITPCIYDEVGSFNSSFAIVCKNDSWGVIDNNGKEVIPCKFKYVSSFSNGLAVVNNNGELGFVDVNGKSTFDY